MILSIEIDKEGERKKVGYINHSMSERAKECYDEGARPLSGWTKADLLEELYSFNKNVNFSKLTTKELHMLFLRFVAWHHTGKYYNCTVFYEIDAEKVELFTDSDIDYVISTRKSERKTHKKRAKLKKIWAVVRFVVWEGNFRNYRKPYIYTEVVNFFETDKIIQTSQGGKRRGNLTYCEIFSTEKQARKRLEKLGYKHKMLNK